VSSAIPAVNNKTKPIYLERSRNEAGDLKTEIVRALERLNPELDNRMRFIAHSISGYPPTQMGLDQAMLPLLCTTRT
jgi:hypothetical protein